MGEGSLDRVLLTGASGGLAQLVLKELARVATLRPLEVLALDISSPEAGVIQPEKTRWSIGALDETGIANHLNSFKPTAIIHLAAITGQRAEVFPDMTERVNVTLPLSIMEQCGLMPHPARFVLASSIAAIGDTGGAAMGDELTPCAPVSHYGRCKRELECEIVKRRANGQDVIALRLPTLLVRTAARKGKPTSGFLSDFVKDLFLNGHAVSPMPEDYPVAVASNAEAARAMVHLAVDPIPKHCPAILNLPALKATPRDVFEQVASMSECRAEYSKEPTHEIAQLIDMWPKSLESIAESELGFEQPMEKSTRLQNILRDALADLRIPAKELTVRD